MNLAIDIGNTRMKLGYFEGAELKWNVTVESFDPIGEVMPLIVDRLTNNSKIIYSKTSDKFDDYIEKLTCSYETLVLDNTTLLPIQIDYKTPETLGRDRVAGVVGARSLYPDQASLVIDAGTCITYDVVDADGVYGGGQICPGLHMRLKAMHHFTDKLPLIEWESGFEMIGKSTEECMVSGAILGTINEMKAFIADYNKAFGTINILITGGDNHFFVLNMKTKILAVPSLILLGLNEILNFNERAL